MLNKEQVLEALDARIAQDETICICLDKFGYSVVVDNADGSSYNRELLDDVLDWLFENGIAHEFYFVDDEPREYWLFNGFRVWLEYTEYDF